MNLLEHYVTNIANVEEVKFDWGICYRITADIDCYGRVEKQKEILLSESEYKDVLERKYYLG